MQLVLPVVPLSLFPPSPSPYPLECHPVPLRDPWRPPSRTQRYPSTTRQPPPPSSHLPTVIRRVPAPHSQSKDKQSLPSPHHRRERGKREREQVFFFLSPFSTPRLSTTPLLLDYPVSLDYHRVPKWRVPPSPSWASTTFTVRIFGGVPFLPAVFPLALPPSFQTATLLLS